MEIEIGLRITGGAVALVNRDISGIVLDESPAARAECGGDPKAIEYVTPFPGGTPVCLNCNIIPGRYDDALSACAAWCADVTNPGVPADVGTLQSCLQRTRVSANASNPRYCFEDACSPMADPVPSFRDPRIRSEAVTWQDLIGVCTGSLDTTLGTCRGGFDNTLTRNAPTPADPGAFDAGGASAEIVTSGDAYVQFTATELDTARLGGFSQGNPPDTNPDFRNIDFAIDLFKNGCFYVFEQGTKAPGPIQDCTQPVAPDAFGHYGQGDTFRVYVLDNGDGTAQVKYAHYSGPCFDGTPCVALGPRYFYESPTPARYPLRVDSSFHDQGATLHDVRLVRNR